MLAWYVYGFLIVALFCQDLRALLIIPRLEDPIDTISQVDFAKTKVALDIGNTYRKV